MWRTKRSRLVVLPTMWLSVEIRAGSRRTLGFSQRWNARGHSLDLPPTMVAQPVAPPTVVAQPVVPPPVPPTVIAQPAIPPTVVTQPTSQPPVPPTVIAQPVVPPTVVAQPAVPPTVIAQPAPPPPVPPTVVAHSSVADSTADTVICSQCGRINLATSSFCAGCGAALPAPAMKTIVRTSERPRRG